MRPRERPGAAAAAAPRSLRNAVPGAVVAVGCVALAALSLLLPFGPAFDPWSWLVWGRELGRLDLDTTAGPSWKPLPVLVAAALAPLAEAAPEAWLLLARLAALAAFVLAWRVAAEIASRYAGTSRVVAGATAVISLALLSDPEPPWARQLLQGTSEPLCAALVLGAIDRHLHRRPRAALALGALAALVRPEAWPLLAAYGIWAWRAEPRMRAPLVAAAVVITGLWLLPDVWGSGDAFTGGDRARVATAPDSLASALGALGDALGGLLALVPAPAWVAAGAAVALALRPPRDRLVTTLAAGAAAWMALVCTSVLVGFAALPRFAVPAAAVACVLAGVGAARLAALTPSRPLVVGLALVAALSLVPRALDVPGDVREAAALARDERDLRAALDRAGGRPGVTACGGPVVRDALVVPALAWHLDLPLSAPGVSRSAVAPPRIVVVRAGERAIDGTVLARAGRWSVIGTGCPAPGGPPVG